jgi:hypothetical protein
VKKLFLFLFAFIILVFISSPVISQPIPPVPLGGMIQENQCPTSFYLGMTSVPLNRSQSNELLSGIIGAYAPAEYSNGTCTTSQKTIDPANGQYQSLTLTAGDTCPITFAYPASGVTSVQLRIIQSTSGSYNGTISNGSPAPKWPGGSVPTITVGTGGLTYDIIICTLDAGNSLIKDRRDGGSRDPKVSGPLFCWSEQWRLNFRS